MNEITKSLVKGVVDSYADLSDQIWAKVHYMVSDQCLAKFVVRNSPLVIDSSDNCSRRRIGLRSFGNVRLKRSTEFALNQFDQGLTMERDRDGNVYIWSNSGSGSNQLEVIGWEEPQLHSLSSDIILRRGRISTKMTKVFDMCEYKSHVALELQRQTMDHDRLHQLSIFCIDITPDAAAAAAVGAEATDQMESAAEDAVPSNWLCIINLAAIDILTNEKVICDIKAMQHLDLIQSPDVQLRRNWSRQESEKRPELEEAEEGRGKGGKKASTGAMQKPRNSKGDGGATPRYSWMTEGERTANSQSSRRIFANQSKRGSFPGERREWSGLIGL